jgi:nucleotide-binding universal stress UspA family protein
MRRSKQSLLEVGANKASFAFLPLLTRLRLPLLDLLYRQSPPGSKKRIKAEQEWIEKIAANALQKLHDAGLSASLEIQAGNPKNVLVEKAESWHADSIFVGANRFGSRVERFLLGSVSAAVAARAHCSVEVVRS